mmetsp:Transcript_683/g.1770  ORF Transcript_683/g.1770 Transcript_683/m.1770 type:complete len:90 (+) Transcript_683:200-469(+)
MKARCAQGNDGTAKQQQQKKKTGSDKHRRRAALDLLFKLFSIAICEPQGAHRIWRFVIRTSIMLVGSIPSETPLQDCTPHANVASRLNG